MRILQTSSSTLQIFIKISISHRIFLAEKIYLINKKEKKKEKKRKEKSQQKCAQPFPIFPNFVPNLPARWRELFRRKIVDGVGFDAKCRSGPTIHPEKYDANLSTFNSPPFYLSPRRASRQYSTQKEHKFRIFYSKAAISPAQPGFFGQISPLLVEGREDRCRDTIAIPLSRGLSWKRLNCSSEMRVEEKRERERV